MFTRISNINTLCIWNNKLKHPRNKFFAIQQEPSVTVPILANPLHHKQVFFDFYIKVFLDLCHERTGAAPAIMIQRVGYISEIGCMREYFQLKNSILSKAHLLVKKQIFLQQKIPSECLPPNKWDGTVCLKENFRFKAGESSGLNIQIISQPGVRLWIPGECPRTEDYNIGGFFQTLAPDSLAGGFGK